MAFTCCSSSSSHARDLSPRENDDPDGDADEESNQQAYPGGALGGSLGRLTAEFDREDSADEFHELSPGSQRRWVRVKRKPGRPRKGQGVKVISVSVEKTLLARSDALARRMGVTRSGLISAARSGLVAQGER